MYSFRHNSCEDDSTIPFYWLKGKENGFPDHYSLLYCILIVHTCFRSLENSELFTQAREVGAGQPVRLFSASRQANALWERRYIIDSWIHFLIIFMSTGIPAWTAVLSLSLVGATVATPILFRKLQVNKNSRKPSDEVRRRKMLFSIPFNTMLYAFIDAGWYAGKGRVSN